jgi:ABC-2 type transport system permease protein
MWGLIGNELLKLGRKNRLYIVLGFLVLITLVCGYARYVDVTGKAPEKVIRECERFIRDMQNVTIITTGGDGGEKEVTVSDGQGNGARVEAAVERAKKDIERAKREIENRDGDWKEVAREEIADLTAERNEYAERDNDADLEAVNTMINKLNYYLDRDMRPEEDYVMTNSVILDIISFAGSIFLAVLVMMLTVDSIAGENAPGTIRLLLSKPVTRGRVYASKYFAALLASLGCVLAVELAAYLVIGVCFGFGNLRAPAAIGPKYMLDPIQIARYGMGVTPVPGSTVLVPLWQKLALLTLLQALFIATVASFGMFVSSVMKNGVQAMILGLLIIAVLTVISLQLKEFGSIRPIRAALPFLFTTYGSGELILSGYLAQALSAPAISVPFAAAVMAAWAAASFLAGYGIFVQRDVLA